MSPYATLLRQHLTRAENEDVTDAEVEGALERAVLGRAPRSRVEVAALLVFRGPHSTSVPPLEAVPLHRLDARRLVSRLRPGRPALSLLGRVA